MSVIAKITVDKYATALPWGLQISQRPLRAEIISHGAATMAVNASNVPPLLARNAANKSPCIKQAQAVVMPQVGHGMPNNTRNEHGGKPNSWCVPS